jgi:hypothetical protein
MSIRKRGNRAYQVRVSPFPAQTVPTREAAERLELNLKLRRVGGAASPERPTTLGLEIDGFLDRARAAGGLRPRSVEFYEQKAKVWSPLRAVRVPALRRAQVQDFIVARAGKHPRSAMDELQFLKRVLREAKERGQHIDEAILSIKPVKHTPRRGRALDVNQLYELASWFPEHVSRLVLVAGQVGARWCTTSILVQSHGRHAQPGTRHHADPGRAFEEQARPLRLPNLLRGRAAP